MPGAGLISLAIAMGRTPSELLAAIENEPEYWRSRFWIYVNAGGR
jgi:hypothetical protein